MPDPESEESWEIRYSGTFSLPVDRLRSLLRGLLRELLPSSPPPESTPPEESSDADVVPLDFLAAVAGIGPAKIHPSERRRLDELRPLYERIGKEKRIPPALLAAIASRESRNRADAVNDRTQAQGLMQILPSNFRRAGVPRHRWQDPETNIRMGARILLEGGWGKKTLEDVLSHYGGFRGEITGPHDDPAPYIREVQAKATQLLARHGFSGLV